MIDCGIEAGWSASVSNWEWVKLHALSLLISIAITATIAAVVGMAWWFFK